MNFAIHAMRTVQWVFLIALIGCAVTVVLVWISILKGCFSEDDE